MIGKSLGRYQILAELGRGGMGEVYRARDTKLDRDVALKILPDAFAADPDRLMRFEREAKTLASLNHPHIAQIYGLEDTPVEAGAPHRALVMELVDGEDLAQRLVRGPLPLDEATVVARQLLEALEAAHAQGIVHRDLKPANIKVRADGTVKVLDFGLAKAFTGDAAAGASTAHLATITSPAMTMRGMILGTAAYMSPEQARGKVVDQRTDIWAFGCVLFEMLSGQRAFDGAEVTDVLARVIEREPEWARLPATTPAAVTALIRRCLRKDQTRRLHHAGDIRLELEDALASPTVAPTPVVATSQRWWVTAGVVAGVVVGALGTATWISRQQVPLRVVTRLQVEIALTSAAVPAAPFVSVSPDGRQLAYRASDPSGRGVLRVRDLTTADERTIDTPLPGNSVAWSPDSRSFLAFSQRRAMLVDAASLSSRDLPWPEVAQAGTSVFSWIDGRRVVFATTGRVYEWDLAASVTPLPSPDGELRRLPAMLPDGRRYLFLKGPIGESELCVGALDSADSRCLTSGEFFAYGRGTALVLTVPGGRVLGYRLDPAAATLVGDPVELSPGLTVTATGGAGVAAVSSDGLVVLQSASSLGQWDLVWFDRTGSRQQPALPPGPGIGIEVSADRRLGVTATPTGGPMRGVWVLDFARGLRTRLIDAPANDVQISPDGRQVAYLTRRELVVQGALGGDARTVFSQETGTLFLEDWSDDGQYLVAGVIEAGTNERAALRVAVNGHGPPLELVTKLTQLDEMRLSPDGKWLAYNAAISGRDEVYVSPVPPTGERIQISADGGTSARWRDDGAELFYLAPDGTLLAVRTPTRDARLDPARPVPLFKTGIQPTHNLDHYAVNADGTRFLLRLPSATRDAPLAMATLIVNWLPR